MSNTISKTRIDKYLWCIRIYKTRSLATDACLRGLVKCNGISVKAAKAVQVGDVYDIKTEARKWKIYVTGIIESRVAYATAILNYKDLTPEEERTTDPSMPSSFTFFTGKRQSKQGRPTKKNRRDRDEYNLD